MLDNPALGLPIPPEHLENRLLGQRFRMALMQPDDEPSIVQVITQTLLRFHDEGEIVASTQRCLPRFYQSYRENGALYLVLKDALSATVIGGVGVRAFAGLDPAESLGEIRELVIDPNFRGLGLGRSLLSVATQKARALGYRRLYLAATSEMRHAQSLFQRSGFRPLAAPQGRESFPSYFVKDE